MLNCYIPTTVLGWVTMLNRTSDPCPQRRGRGRLVLRHFRHILHVSLASLPLENHCSSFHVVLVRLFIIVSSTPHLMRPRPGQSEYPLLQTIVIGSRSKQSQSESSLKLTYGFARQKISLRLWAAILTATWKGLKID